MLLSRRKLLKGNFLLLAISSFLFITSGYIVMPMLPVYLGGMGALEVEVGFIVGLVPLTAVFCRIPVGMFIDKHGRHGMLLTGIFLQAMSPFLYTICTDTTQFMVVRVINGLGFAAFIVTSDTMVIDLSPRGHLGEVLGVFSICFLSAQAIGPSISGLLQSNIGHISTFYVSGTLALLATIIALRIRVPPHRSSTRIIGSLSRVLRNRNLTTASLVLFVIMMPHGVMPAFLPLYATSLGIGPEGVGLFFTVFALGMGGIRPFIGALSDRVGRVTVAVPFGLLSALGLASFSLAGDLPGLLAAGILLGIGMGAAHSAIYALSVDTMKPRLRGQAVSVAGAATDAGISTGAIGMGPIAMTGGFPTMFGTAAVFVVVGTAAFLGVRSMWKKEERIYT